MAPEQELNAVFQVTVDPTVYIGSAVVLHNVAQAQYQADVENFLLKIGLIVEDWESGNFNKFDWEFAGDANWMIDPTTKYEGDYSSKSSAISDGQSAQLVIQYNVMYDDSISFFRKVSSQPLSDRLKFYIDDLPVGNWSGNQDWKYSAYPVLAGPHTFKWIYEKDATGSMNLDAAWVDYIVFPPEYKLAVNAGGDATSCGLTPYQPGALAINYDSLLWTTSGTGNFDDPKLLRPLYTPSEQDLSSGSVILTLTAWTLGFDSTDQVVLTLAPEVTASAGTDGAVCSNGSFTLEEASANNYGSLAWTTSGDGSFEDPATLNTVYTPGEADIATGTVTLTLTAVPSVACPSVTDDILLTVHTAPAVNLGQDTSICANLQYLLDATTPDPVSYLWSPGGETTSTIMADSSGTGIGNKLISVVVTDQNGCNGTDAITLNFKDCTGISEIPGIGINIYPNPGSGLFHLDLKANGSETVRLRVFSVNGEQILEERELKINRSLSHPIDLSSKGNGTYFLELSREKDRVIRKLVVSK